MSIFLRNVTRHDKEVKKDNQNVHHNIEYKSQDTN
jgi:hypothetical protein